MKSKKSCEMTACGKGYRHELLGLILLVLATVLTIFTGNSLGIFGMFLVGLALFCRKFWHCNCPCHGHEHGHSDDHCHALEEEFSIVHVEKEHKPVKKAKVKKAKV